MADARDPAARWGDRARTVNALLGIWLFASVFVLPDESDAAFNLRASVHYALGDYANALADHERAHELDPDDAGTLNFLAWIRAT